MSPLIYILAAMLCTIGISASVTFAGLSAIYCRWKSSLAAITFAIVCAGLLAQSIDAVDRAYRETIAQVEIGTRNR